jgi:hypothetical protein
MKVSHTNKFSLLFPSILLVSWITIIIMAATNPSGTVPMKDSSFWGVITLVLGALGAGVLPYWAVFCRRRVSFLASVIIGVIALIGLAWGAATAIHRDFFSYPTQVIMIYITIIVYKVDELDIIERKREVYPHIVTGAMVIFALWIGWLMMMSYAIVVREEPRWIESSVYNVINGVIGIVLVIAAITLRNRSKRSLILREDGVYLDERNISQLLSPQENRIVLAFINAPSHTLTCKTLREWLDPAIGATNGKAAGKESTKECERCMSEKWTAYDCATYRNLKNRINDAKKYLELLQIGTIVPAEENRREIKMTGWCLRLFDDVRLVRSSMNENHPGHVRLSRL